MSIQTTYGASPATRKRGQQTRTAKYIKSVKAVESLEADCALVYSGYPADKTLVRKPMQTQYTITMSRDYEALNSTVGDIVVTPLGGEATTTSLTATVYASSHAATMEAIAVKIRAVTGIKSCTVDATARTFTIIASGDRDVSASGFTTTLGTNQATYTYAAGSADEIAGIATNRDAEPDDDGYTYLENDTVKMLINGGVSVLAEEEVTTESTVYFRFAGTGRGLLRDTAGSAPIVAAPFAGNGFIEIQTGAAADGLADLEVNLAGA